MTEKKYTPPKDDAPADVAPGAPHNGGGVTAAADADDWDDDDIDWDDDADWDYDDPACAADPAGADDGPEALSGPGTDGPEALSRPVTDVAPGAPHDAAGGASTADSGGAVGGAGMGATDSDGAADSGGAADGGDQWDDDQLDDEEGYSGFGPGGYNSPNRDAFRSRMSERYPNLDLDDDEAFYGQIGKDYDDYEERLSHHEAQAKTLSDMFAHDPRSASFLLDMSRGKSPFASYIQRFGPEIKDMLDDPAVADQIARAEADYMQRKLENDTLEREYEQNINGTREMLLDYQAQRGLGDEELEIAMAALIGMVRDGIMGKFSTQALDMMLAAINHDSDVALAQEQGRIEGRNAKITEQLRSRAQGDGVGSLGGKPAQPGGGSASIFDIAAAAR